MKKKMVLVTVKDGIPAIYADHGVNAVILNYDSMGKNPNAISPIHSDFLPLMQLAGAIGDWALKDDGKLNDAENLPDSTWTFLFKGRPPVAVRVECVMKPEFTHGMLGRKFLWLHHDEYWKGESISNQSQTFPFESVLAWALPREFPEDYHDE